MTGPSGRAVEGQPPAGRLRVVVLAPEVVGVPSSESGDLTNDIVRQITKHSRIDLVPDNEVDAAVAGWKGSHGPCAADEDCLASVGRAVSADGILTGSFRKSDGRYTLELTLRPVRGDRTPARASQEMKQIKSLTMNVGLCLDELFKWNDAASAGEAAIRGAVAPRSASGLPQRVAILDVQLDGFANGGDVVHGAEFPQAQLVPALIAGELAHNAAYTLVDLGDVREAARLHTKNPNDCGREAACVAQVGRALRADLVVTSVVEAAHSSFTLTIRVQDPASTAAPAETSESVESLRPLPGSVKRCTARLFQPPPAPSPPAAMPTVAMAAASQMTPASAADQSAPPVVTPPTPAPEAAPSPAADVAAPVVSATPVHPAESRLRVMVMDFVPVGVDAQVAAGLVDRVALELSRHPGFDVASRDDVRHMMEQEQRKQAGGCAQDSECLVEISRKLAADRVVSGSIGRIGASFSATVVVSDPKNMTDATRANETVASVEALPAAIASCLAKVFKWGAATVSQFHLPKGKKLSFAIFDLKPQGLSAEAAQNLTQMLSVEVKGVQGASVVSSDDIKSMLQLQQVKSSVGCGDDSCMTELAGALGVDRLITGDAGKLGTTFVVNLRLIDVSKGIVENRVAESYEGEEEQLLRAVRHAARSLLGLTEVRNGRLAVTSSQSGAAVLVDETKRGVAPLEAMDLSAGPHALRVTRAGYFDWHGDVFVDPGETTPIWAQLKEQPERWYQKWWLWTVVGVVAAGGVGVGIYASRPLPQSGTATAIIR